MGYDILSQKFLGNMVLDYITVALVFLASILVIRLVRQVFIRRLKAWAEKTSTTFDDFTVSILQKVVVPL
ncbi:hypothetical protein ACFL2W_00740, partial [Candidatus Omnitrophota bacterium]